MNTTPQTVNGNDLDKVQGGWGWFGHRPHRFPPPWYYGGYGGYGGFYGPPVDPYAYWAWRASRYPW